MRIISLNTWHGERKLELKDYLSSQLETTDVFCFQEANQENIENIISELFDAEQFSVVSATKITAGDRPRHYSLITLVKHPLQLVSSQPLLDSDDSTTGAALATTLQDQDGKEVTVVNVHGIPYAIDDKLDTEGRLNQTDQILSWLGKQSDIPSVVCGDFNLFPETESIKKFSDKGYRNLIAEYAIPTTRNQLAWERHTDKQLFADYTFTSSDLKVIDFSVPDNQVSDHLPMVVTITI